MSEQTIFWQKRIYEGLICCLIVEIAILHFQLIGMQRRELKIISALEIMADIQRETVGRFFAPGGHLQLGANQTDTNRHTLEIWSKP